MSAGERGVLRDKLQALLWPDADDERGRRIVAQMLYTLRRDLGSDDVILGSKELRLNPQRVNSDRADFERALAAGDAERAAAVYTGAFLDGFRLPGVPEFERWADEERSALAHRYAALLEKLARAAEDQGDASSAVAWWQKLAAQDPLNARVAVALMQALADAGDRPSAIRHAQIYGALVEQELDLPPAQEVQALTVQLRAELDEVPAPTQRTSILPAEAPDASARPPVQHTVADHHDAPRPSVRRRPRAFLTAVALGLVIFAGVLVLVRTRVSTPHASVPAVLAIGLISDYSADSASVARPLADLLATSLARVQALRVISGARIHELIRQLDQDPANAGSFALAARHAGATGLIDGALFPLEDGGHRLDLRWTDLPSGDVVAAHTVAGADLFALVDSGTARLAANIGAPVPGSIGDVTTHSLAAYRLYEQGLRTLYRGEPGAAAPLFDAALAEDSSFAMAAYYGAHTHWNVRSEALARFAHALRLAEHASDRERLVIRAGWAAAVSDPSLLAVAETLAVRYPHEVEGHLYTGRALLEAGDYRGALARLRRVLAMDSLALRGSAARCSACEALQEMISAYQALDSLPAAERLARWWASRQADSAEPWRRLSGILVDQERPTEAREAFSRAASIDRTLVGAPGYQAHFRARFGEYEAAERALRDAIATGTPERRHDALWYLTLTLRMQGRFSEALEVARNYRATRPEADAAPASVSYSALQEAQVLLEAQRPRAAAALFDSIARWRLPGEQSAYIARHRIWSRTHAATAYAAAGDTAQLASLADTLRRLGPYSSLGRDRRLHHYVHGLLFVARGDDAAAIPALRASIISPTTGYTRASYELARALLRQRRPGDAITVLQPAFRGGLEASNLYITHAELHELLGQAWDAVGRADSAAAHYQALLAAWHRPDPQLHDRITVARQRLTALNAR